MKDNRDRIRFTLKLALLFLLFSFSPFLLFSQEPDTLRIDTTKVVEKEVHPQDIKPSKFEINFSGFVKLNALYDFAGMSNTEGFIPFEIPVDSAINKELTGIYIGARQSRIGMESIAQTKFGPIRTYIEMDFAGTNTGIGLRLRHAYGQIGNWTLGYTWTTFTDLKSIPYTIDYEGPNSGVYVRQGLIRYAKKFGEHMDFAVSIENPRTDFQNPYDTLNVETRQQEGDMAGSMKHTDKWGHLQAAAVIRAIQFVNAKGKTDLKMGMGVLFSGKIKPADWGTFYFQWIIGEGIAWYIGGLSGRGLDAFPNQFGSLDLLVSQGGFVAYSYSWTPKIFSTVIAGYNKVENTDLQPEDAFKSSTYGSVNTFYDLLPSLRFGLELTIGQRVNKNNHKGGATRVQFVAQFSF